MHHNLETSTCGPLKYKMGNLILIIRGAAIPQKAYCDILRYGKPVLWYILPYIWYLYFCLLLPLVLYYNIIKGSWNWHLLHTVIFSATPCVPRLLFKEEMIKFLLFPFRYLTTIICDCHLPSFLKLKAVVACWSNLQHEQICTSFTNEPLVFEIIGYWK